MYNKEEINRVMKQLLIDVKGIVETIERNAIETKEAIKEFLEKK